MCVHGEVIDDGRLCLTWLWHLNHETRRGCIGELILILVGELSLLGVRDHIEVCMLLVGKLSVLAQHAIVPPSAIRGCHHFGAAPPASRPRKGGGLMWLLP